MHDSLGRTVNYLRLSITDRCNLRCCYCMPAAGVDCCGHDKILRYEELLAVARAAVSLGVEKIRVTGGEPLVRKGVLDFLGRLSTIPGLTETTLTTNGLLLAATAERIRAAGVQRLNVSLDSLDATTYAEITRGGDLAQVLAGLDAAEQAGLRLKLNMVVMRGINDHEVEAFAALSLNRPWSVRFIEYMPTIREHAWQNRIVTGSEIVTRLQQRFTLEPLATTPLCGPARPYRIIGGQGSIGIITPMSDHFCGHCNRLRITARGFAKSCLLSEQATDLRKVLPQGQDAIRTALLAVIAGKGDLHHFADEERTLPMSGIGG